MVGLMAAGLGAVSAAGVAIIAYMLRQKDETLAAIAVRVAQLEIRHAVVDQANKHRDEKMERVEDKLDRIIDKLGA